MLTDAAKLGHHLVVRRANYLRLDILFLDLGSWSVFSGYSSRINFCCMHVSYYSFEDLILIFHAVV